MFNTDSRTKNVARTSFFSVSSSVLNIIFGFVYRAVFLYVLSETYLGINGLFTNVLAILSFAELGITNAIVFRLYSPIANNDLNKVGRLMFFFKKVYRLIALAIIICGLLFLPFIDFLIKDPSEVPGDVNLTIVYLLFLFQTASSYLFVYKQTMLSADQRQDVVSIANIIINISRYSLQILLLLTTKNYIVVLASGVLFTLLSNILFSEWVRRRYKDVFSIKEDISREEKRQIYDDTKASLCHKVGGTVLNSTDNIIISKFIGLATIGFYSNYSLVFGSMLDVLSRLFGSFTSSLGNAHFQQDISQKYISYRRLLFANLWVISICTVCLYTLIDDFITIWLGNDMLLSKVTVIVLCIQFFLESSRFVSTSYTFGCGLFVKDKIRPFIESAINLLVSIVLAQRIGLAGIFIGTIVSHLCTVTWREPYLLYKYEFKTQFIKYWLYYIPSAVLTAIMCVGSNFLFSAVAFSVSGILSWLLKAILVFIGCNIVYIILMHNNEDYKFYRTLLISKVKGGTSCTY